MLKEKIHMMLLLVISLILEFSTLIGKNNEFKTENHKLLLTMTEIKESSYIVYMSKSLYYLSESKIPLFVDCVPNHLPMVVVDPHKVNAEGECTTTYYRHRLFLHSVSHL